MERSDGTVVNTNCQPAPEGVCTWDDLNEFLFLARTTPTDGVEIRVAGWSDEACEDALAINCETFGVSVIDLGTADTAPLWCECPYLPNEP